MKEGSWQSIWLDEKDAMGWAWEAARQEKFTEALEELARAKRYIQKLEGLAKEKRIS